MNNEIIDNYLKKFEEDLRRELLTLCSQDKWLNKTLLESQDITDYWLTVEEKYIADAAKKLGASVKFVDAVHFVKGEGIEKKQEDFAAEVAAQMNMGK